MASCMLDVLKGIRNKTLVGGAKKGELRFLCSCNYAKSCHWEPQHLATITCIEGVMWFSIR